MEKWKKEKRKASKKVLICAYCNANFKDKKSKKAMKYLRSYVGILLGYISPEWIFFGFLALYTPLEVQKATIFITLLGIDISAKLSALIRFTRPAADKYFSQKSLKLNFFKL
jgi:hypothetical protein